MALHYYYKNYRHIIRNNKAPKYTKRKLTEVKKEISNSIIGDINTPLLIIYKPIKININKELNNLKTLEVNQN